MVDGFLNDELLNENIQLHLLRHFFTTDDAYRKEFLSTGFSKLDFDKQLAMSGGKFHSHFASNPKVLWKKLLLEIEKRKLQFSWRNNKGECKLVFTANEYVEGIGFDGIVKLDDLTKEDAAHVTLEERDGMSIYVYKETPKRITWQVNVIVQNKDGQTSIKTIFPGTLAPPFPRKGYLSEDDFEASKLFWDQVALVK